jgi:GR25 family glycosyltransferase involved in LPS biosynthesis
MITPNKYFDEIYCINLNHRVDKWENVNARFKRLHLHVNRWQGVDGSKAIIKREYDDIKYENTHCHISRVGAYAIVKTYIELYEHILNNTNHDKVLIFQDDVTFHKDFKNRFDLAIKYLPDDWNMWFLGASQYSFEDISIVIDEEQENFYTANGTDGLFAVAIKTELIEKTLLPALKLFYYPADNAHRIFTQDNQDNHIYVSYPFLCGHDVGFSDNYNIEIGELETYSIKWAHRKYDTKIYF